MGVLKMICDILTEKQIINALDKGLKSYENLLGVETLEKNR